MVKKRVAFGVLMSLGFGLMAEVEKPALGGAHSGDDSAQGTQEQGEPSFYTKEPFFNLETLLASSDELREQYAALSDADKALLIEIFDQFNDDFQKVFFAMPELDGE